MTGDNGKSHKPAYVVLVGTHADRLRTSPPAEDLRQKLLTKFGKIFNIEKTTLSLDAHAAGSQEMKTLKNLLQQKKQQLIEVRESMHDSGDHIEQYWTVIILQNKSARDKSLSITPPSPPLLLSSVHAVMGLTCVAIIGEGR